MYPTMQELSAIRKSRNNNIVLLTMFRYPEDI